MYQTNKEMGSHIVKLVGKWPLTNYYSYANLGKNHPLYHGYFQILTVNQLNFYVHLGTTALRHGLEDNKLYHLVLLHVTYINLSTTPLHYTSYIA